MYLVGKGTKTIKVESREYLILTPPPLKPNPLFVPCHVLQTEDDVLSRVMKETQERIRLFEENQRRWQDQQQPQHMQSPPPLTQVSYDVIITSYCIAGNFRWCKLSRFHQYHLQKQFRGFNFRAFSVLRRHEVCTFNFRCSYFRGSQAICEKQENLHHAKLSSYTVLKLI